MQRYRQSILRPRTRSIKFKSPLHRSSTPVSKPEGTKFDLSNKRELMNCIAYSPGNQRDSRWLEVWDEDSFSSDTSSDITDVSPASSLSDFGGILVASKPSTSEDTTFKDVDTISENVLTASLPLNDKATPTDNTRNNKNKLTLVIDGDKPRTPPIISPVEDVKDELTVTPALAANHDASSALASDVHDERHGEVVSDSAETREDDEEGELKLLVAALSELEGGGQQQRAPPAPLQRSRLNISFTPDKARQIARENANLLGRLQRARMRGPQVSPPHGPPEASAAINRRHKQRQIQHENMILLRKITAARATTSINPRVSATSCRPRSASTLYSRQLQ